MTLAQDYAIAMLRGLAAEGRAIREARLTGCPGRFSGYPAPTPSDLRGLGLDEEHFETWAGRRARQRATGQEPTR